MGRRIVRVPPEACGGVQHVVAVCPEGTETARVAQDRDALLLRFASSREVCTVAHRLELLATLCSAA